MEEELALNDADPSNAVSKKCKHGVKTLVDTIVDQPCQYGNVVIMSYGGYYDAYPMWSPKKGTSIGVYYVIVASCQYSQMVIMSQVL